MSPPGAGDRARLAPRPPGRDDVAQEPAGPEATAGEGAYPADRPGRAEPPYAEGVEPAEGLGLAEPADRAGDREAAGYGPPESLQAVPAPPATDDAEHVDCSQDQYADGEPPEGFGPADGTERAGALEDAGYGPPEGPGTRAARAVRADVVARRKRSGGRSGAAYTGGDGTPQDPGLADRSGDAEPAGRPERPASGSEPPPRPAAPAGRRELLDGYERMDGPEPEPEPEAPDRQERAAALPERPERLRRTGRLERPTRPVRAERPLRPPRPPRQEPPPPAPPARPDPYERPDLPELSELPELPGQSLPAVPDQPGPGASPARTRSAQPARTAPPGGDHAEPLEPAARATSLEPASRPPVVSRESTPPRRQPLAAPPQPGPRVAPGAEFVGQRPPTYDAEPTAWPAADPQDLEGLVPDTVLDGAQYGAVTLRALSLRGDSARYRGEPRRDALLTARFGDGDGALLLVAMASGLRGTDVAPRAARDACRWLAGAVGRSHARLADDIRGGRRGELKSGLHRLTDRSYGRLRARAAELGLRPDEYTATVRCLLLTADPQCRTRVFFGVGAGGLFRLREGVWQDLEPDAPPERTGEPVVGYGAAPADTMTVDLGIPTPGLTPPVEPEEPAVPGEPFRFRASVARPGDTLMLCTAGLAEPMRGEPELGGRLAERWAGARPPGLAAFLADIQLRVKGYADDRTACALWEA
ncbi:protein phosphatase 2C domain-containing protein [Streptomyces sp. URMC 127]|uniref:protein phosphatase 2C domain-containing protein n=1 Tax=Streptomyces sp. URMC 127 TaxID=3423402 RepID=UPI003F197071